MAKKLIGMLFLAGTVLAGCSGSTNYDVKLTKPVYSLKDKPAPIEVKITEGGEAASGLKLSGELTMAEMDHGAIKVDFAQGKNGVYKADAKLPMAGKYEIALKLNRDGKKSEKVLNLDVKKPVGVATINGEWITNEDLKFYNFINKLHTAINRERDKQNYKGKELEDALAYWDAQDKINEDKNQLLTQIIRLRSVALLAEDKGHKATKAEIDQQLKDIKSQYGQFAIANKMIGDFGKEKFWAKERSQYEMIVLTQKVQQDLITKAKKENPAVGDQEVQYLAQKAYEELLVSQVNSLKIVIL